MELLDKLRDLSARATRIRASIQTEEACKNAFVMPFLGALGYDVFNPEEVVPEFIADVGIKKGEKVDYAVRKDGKIIILVECKWNGKALSVENASQLFRYFVVTSARCAILTNGLVFQFFTDIDEPNKMDRHPFFVFNLLDFTEAHVDELRRFARDTFDINSVISAATAMKYTNQVKQLLSDELSSPSDAFVKLFTAKIVEGRTTQSVIEQFAPIVHRAFNEFIRDRLSDRLKSALRDEAPQVLESQPIDQPIIATSAAAEPVSDVVTTDDELEGYRIVRAICRELVDVRRVIMRDAKSYCAILLDDNNRKPIARLHFNAQSKRYLGVFVAKTEERIEIAGLDDIYAHAEKLKAAVREYETSK